MIILYDYLHYAVKAFVNRIGVKESYEDAEGTSCLFCDRQVEVYPMSRTILNFRG